MDSLLFQKLIYACIIFAISIFSGLYPLTKYAKNIAKLKFNESKTLSSNEYVIGEAIASGIFLGAALLHMLGDASRDFIEMGYHYPIASLLAGIVFLTLLLFEHIGREMNEHPQGNNMLFVFLAVVMLSVHSLLEGVALGTRSDLSLLLVIFLAIIAHKWAASYSLAVQIAKSNPDKTRLNWLLFLIFAIMTPVGIFFGNMINTGLETSSILAPVFTALAAGTFLYIGTLHGLNRAVLIERCCNLNAYLFVILGFGLMAVIGIWV